MHVVSFYTVNTPYEQEAEELQKTLDKFNLKSKIYPVENLKRWELNCGQKPLVLKKALEELKEDILYVDSDARFLREPPLEDIWRNVPGFSIWHNPWGGRMKHKLGEFELLSGTIYLPYTPDSFKVLNLWEEEILKNPMEWDQKSLQKVYSQVKHQELPLEWCYIKSGMCMFISNPIILHTQASRKLRRAVCK